MAPFGNLSFGRHLLIAVGLLLGICVFLVVQNWDTFTLMYANVAAMNEGKEVAETMRRPEDLLSYLSSHPEKASLVAYDVGAKEEGIFYRSAVQRPLVNTSHLLLLAEYARRVETGQLDPSRRVPLDSVAIYALPGAGLSNHEEAVAHWRTTNEGRQDSTVALRQVVEAIAQFRDEAAADWFLTALGRSQVQSLPSRWGLERSEQPLPSSGIYLSWTTSAQGVSVGAAVDFDSWSREAYADRVYRLVRRLRRDSSFRERERRQLRQRGSGLSIREQRALAQATYANGTAADYATLLARSVEGDLGSTSVANFVQRQIESPIERDSLDAPIEALGTHVGAMPGIISFVGYIRYSTDRPPRVVSLFLEGLPIGLFYHVVQTSLDKGFQLRLLTDPDFFRRVQERLSQSPETPTNREEDLPEDRS